MASQEALARLRGLRMTRAVAAHQEEFAAVGTVVDPPWPGVEAKEQIESLDGLRRFGNDGFGGRIVITLILHQRLGNISMSLHINVGDDASLNGVGLLLRNIVSSSAVDLLGLRLVRRA